MMNDSLLAAYDRPDTFHGIALPPDAEQAGDVLCIGPVPDADTPMLLVASCPEHARATDARLRRSGQPAPAFWAPLALRDVLRQECPIGMLGPGDSLVIVGGVE